MRDTTRFGRVNEALDKALTRLGIDPTTPNTYLPDMDIVRVNRSVSRIYNVSREDQFALTRERVERETRERRERMRERNREIEEPPY